jgi:hypothetical protein
MIHFGALQMVRQSRVGTCDFVRSRLANMHVQEVHVPMNSTCFRCGDVVLWHGGGWGPSHCRYLTDWACIQYGY